MISKLFGKSNKENESKLGQSIAFNPAKVIEDKNTSLTFTVDNVDIETKKPDLVSAQELFKQLIGDKVQYEDSSHRELKDETFLKGDVPGFILALHTAYEHHYPLKLSVSDFIVLIGQGLGRHMDKYSEKLRKHFVDHEEKEEIIVRRDHFVKGSQNDWSTVFGEFADKIKERLKTDFYGVVVDDSSVATKESRIVSEIALMDCMKGYFDYIVVTRCGIPQITLEGSKKDWEGLLNKVMKLKELNKDNCLFLDFWLTHLIPVVEQICETAISRKPNSEFWSGIYKYTNPGSGTPYISGWCTVFLPYLSGGENAFQKPAHVTTNTIPKQISELLFIWDYMHQLIPMKFYGGFLGAKFDKEKKRVEPAYFWAVTYDKERKNVERKYQKEEDKY